jgi:hypothetical protein
MEEIKCDFCKKIIQGHTPNQVKYMLMQHKLAKHSDKIEIQINGESITA